MRRQPESVFRSLLPFVLGLTALAMAFHGQMLVLDSVTRVQGTRWYAAAVVLLILAWRGTYKNLSALSLLQCEEVRRRSEGATEDGAQNRESSKSRGLRIGIALAALLFNLYSVTRLRKTEYDSNAAALGWVVSLVLLATAFAERRARLRHRERTGDTRPPEPADLRLSRAVETALYVAIFVLALGLRLYRLGDWTTGVHGDEGEVGLDVLKIIEGQRVPPFRTGWFGQPNFYYWGVALGMKLFGTGLLGLRMFSAIAGALIILPFYPLARRLFGVRTALLASVFLAVSDVAVHFSRQEFSNITTPLFLVTGFYFFFRGLQSGRAIPFVLAGYAHMACLYFYLGGRLTPIVAAAYIGYLAVVASVAALWRGYRVRRAEDSTAGRWDAARRSVRGWLGGARRYVSFGLAYALASLCFASPWMAYYLDHRQEWDSRVHEKLVFNHPAEMAEEHGASHDPLSLGVRLPRAGDVLPLPVAFEETPLSIRLSKDGFWPRVLWGQVTKTLSILTYKFDSSEVYTFTGEPATKPLEAALIVLGIAWALWRWRDARMALLSLWFWLTVVLGGSLTINAPYLARLIGIVPVLALFAAIVADKLAADLIRACEVLARPPMGARLGRALGGAALVLLAGFLVWQNVTDYFGRYLGKWPFAPTTGQAYFVREFDAKVKKEGRPAPRYYDVGAHFIYWNHGVNLFLNNGALGADVQNVSDALPVLDNQNHDVVFMVWAICPQYLRIIRAYYPEGEEGRFLFGPAGRQLYLFTYYRVKREQIEARRSLEATYAPARGDPIRKNEASLGLAGPPPANLVYPVRAAWKGSLIIPAYGLYRFRLETTDPASLVLDDTTVLATRDQIPAEGEVVLARGSHSLSLGATLRSSASKVVALWSVGVSPPDPVPSRFLWSGTGGSLLGEVHAVANRGEELKSPSFCGTDSPPVTQRRSDGFLGFRDASSTLSSGVPLMACWTGELKVDSQGLYRFDVFSNGGSRMSVDGNVVVDNLHEDGAPISKAGEVELRPGRHRVELLYFWANLLGFLEVSWTPPGGQRELIGPEHFATKAGLWRPDQVPEPPPAQPGLIQEISVPTPTLPVKVPDTRGCAVDAQGNLYVADKEHDRLAVWKGGQLARSWGAKGQGPGDFITVEDVSIGPDRMVYVLDSALARVQVFSPEGRLVRSLEKVGCGPAGFTVGADGTIYVAATCDNAVRAYAPGSQQPAEYRGGSDATTRLEQPVDVAVAPDGKLYVADLRNRVVRIDPSSGAIEKIWPVRVGRASGGANLAFGGHFLFVTDSESALLYSIDTETGRIETLPAGRRTDADFAARRSGVGPCASAFGLSAFSRFPLCVGELLARCHAEEKRPSPR